MGVVEFQVHLVLADADLDTPAGRDRALEEARKLIAVVPERSATHDALVREVADRLDLPADYVTAAPTVGGRQGAPEAPRSVLPAGNSPGEAAFAAEREFLVMCLATGELGREYLGRLFEDHLSFPATRGGRQHLLSHFDDPLADLPQDDPAVAALVTGVAVEGQERAEATEPALRMGFLQLEQRRIEREIRRAESESDLVRVGKLAGAKQDIRREMDTVMGQTA